MRHGAVCLIVTARSHMFLSFPSHCRFLSFLLPVSFYISLSYSRILDLFPLCGSLLGVNFSFTITLSLPSFRVALFSLSHLSSLTQTPSYLPVSLCPVCCLTPCFSLTRSPLCCLFILYHISSSSLLSLYPGLLCPRCCCCWPRHYGVCNLGRKA